MSRATELADELDAMAERITRYTNSPGDSLCAESAEEMRRLDRVNAELERDAARYRLLRCYELTGVWPRRASADPGILAFTAAYDDPRKYTQNALDKMLDEMLALRTPGNVDQLRSDWKEWRTGKTAAAIDAALTSSTGDTNGHQ